MRIANDLIRGMMIALIVTQLSFNHSNGLEDQYSSISKPNMKQVGINFDQSFIYFSDELMAYGHYSKQRILLNYEVPAMFSQLKKTAFYLNPVSGSSSMDRGIRPEGIKDRTFESKNLNDSKLTAQTWPCYEWQDSTPALVYLLEGDLEEGNSSEMENQFKSADPSHIIKGFYWQVANDLMKDYAIVKVKTVKSSPKFEMDGSVSGYGFLSVQGHLLTSDRGIHINYKESGSGSCLSHHSLNNSKTRLGTTRELSATQGVAIWNLTRGRTILLNTSWVSNRDMDNIKSQTFLREDLNCQQLNYSASIMSYKSVPSWTSSGTFMGIRTQEVRWKDNISINYLAGNFTSRTIWRLQDKEKHVTPEKLWLGCLCTS